MSAADCADCHFDQCAWCESFDALGGICCCGRAVGLPVIPYDENVMELDELARREREQMRRAS